jgi:hypothetical protein
VSRSPVQFDREVGLGIWPKALDDAKMARLAGTPKFISEQPTWDRLLLDWYIERMPEPSYVYFIQAGDGGPIKIGIARSPERRLIELQVGNHAKLRILALTPGGWGEERALHDKFAALRLNGEWFDPAPELLSYIEAIDA